MFLQLKENSQGMPRYINLNSFDIITATERSETNEQGTRTYIAVIGIKNGEAINMHVTTGKKPFSKDSPEIEARYFLNAMMKFLWDGDIPIANWNEVLIKAGENYINDRVSLELASR